MNITLRIAQASGCIALSLLVPSLGLAAQAEDAGTTYLWSNFVGVPGDAGHQDGLRTASRFSGPVAIAVVQAGPKAGTLYVADQVSHTIREVSPEGAVSTLAGNPGTSGASDGVGAGASFNRPRGVAVDSAGNVFVADEANHTIRKVTPRGEVTTIAGQPGVAGYSDGKGAEAQFRGPSGVAVDANGNVFVGDSLNSVIRKITPDGEVTTIAGEPGERGTDDGSGRAARFITPYSLCIDSNGNLFVADFGALTIRKVTPEGVVTTLAGSARQGGATDGMGDEARFAQPLGIAADAQGNLFVTEFRVNHTIRRVTPEGQVTTIGGITQSAGFEDGIGTAARFLSPIDIAVSADGILYVADRNNRISRGTRFTAR